MAIGACRACGLQNVLPDGEFCKGCNDAMSGPKCVACGRDSKGCVYCAECSKSVRCPHGEPLNACGPCEVAADLAFDSWREDQP
jgi:hypothetical protein